jgi:hypothetical protein
LSFQGRRWDWHARQRRFWIWTAQPPPRGSSWAITLELPRSDLPELERRLAEARDG